MCCSQTTDDKPTLTGGSSRITGTAEPKVVKYCTQAISILATGCHITNKRGVVMVL